MNVKKVTPVTGEIVETDNEQWPTYRRSSSDNWENLMGESWESCYSEEVELEAAYQAFKKVNHEF